jgi:hypothetical protein
MRQASLEPHLWAAISSLAVVAASAIAYSLKPTRGRSILLQASAVLAYLLTNLIP